MLQLDGPVNSSISQEFREMCNLFSSSIVLIVKADEVEEDGDD